MQAKVRIWYNTHMAQHLISGNSSEQLSALSAPEMKVFTVKSAVKHLNAIAAYSNGRKISEVELQATLVALCDYTTSEAQRIWNLNQSILEPAITATGSRAIPYKQRFLRDSGADSTMTPLSDSLIGNLRELVEYKVISEASSWVKNPNPHKQPFSFNRNLDLSATGNQFSKISYSSEQHTVLLQLRAFTEILFIEIRLPEYLKSRQISKLSKPRLRWSGTEYVFDFTLFETVKAATGKLVAGVDLGTIKPYVAAVVSPKGARVASFEANRGLVRGWEKYQELGRHTSWLTAKIQVKEALSLEAKDLRLERDRVRAKRSRLHAELSKRQAAELAQKLSALPVSLVRVEDLSWLAGSKGKSGKGGRWNYARQQADLAHRLDRSGVKLVKKSPRDSSQKCFKCGETLQHRGRSVNCARCKSSLDRDFNAAMNMATLNHLKTKEWLAKFYGLSEADCSVEQVSGGRESTPEANVGAPPPLGVAKLAT